MLQRPNNYYHSNGNIFEKKTLTAAKTSPLTDEALIAAQTGNKRIAVFFVEKSAGAAIVSTFNSKGASTGTAVDTTHAQAANSTLEKGSPDNNVPLFVTNAGEGLSITSTGAGALSYQVIYAIIP